MITLNRNALYTSEELAELLGVNDVTARRLLVDGKVPSRKIGKRRYVSGARLLEFVAEGSDTGQKEGAD